MPKDRCSAFALSAPDRAGGASGAWRRRGPRGRSSGGGRDGGGKEAEEPAAAEHGRRGAAHGEATPAGRQGKAKEPLSARKMLSEFWYNFRHNLFKPLLFFFYMGFLIPILKVKFDFPYVIYQGLTIYLLIAIGWKGARSWPSSTSRRSSMPSAS